MSKKKRLHFKYKPPQAAHSPEFLKILFTHRVNSAQMVCSKQHTFLAFFFRHLHGGPQETQRMKKTQIPRRPKGIITAVIRSASE